MRVVIDTSVLVSAAIRDRLPEQVLLWCVAQPRLEWLVTAESLEEYIEVIDGTNNCACLRQKSFRPRICCSL